MSCKIHSFRKTNEALYTSPLKYVWRCETCGSEIIRPEPGDEGIKVLSRREAYELRPEMYDGMSPEELEIWLSGDEEDSGR